MITIAEVEKSLRRILVFFFPEPKEQLEYVESIHEQVSGRCTAEIFDRVCKEVAAKMKPGHRPVPLEYLEIIRGIQSLNRKAGVCSRCGGRRLVEDRIFNEHTQTSAPSYAPCPECSKAGKDGEDG